MNRYTIFASIILVGLNVGVLYDLHVEKVEAVRAAEEKEENLQSVGSSLLDCADDLTECQSHCTREAAAAFERGNQLFKCMEDICRINGWTPPEDPL